MLQKQIDRPGVAHAVDRASWEFEPAGSSVSEVFGATRFPAELRQRNRWPKLPEIPEIPSEIPEVIPGAGDGA